MIESEQLGHPAAHGMADDDRTLRVEMVHQRDYVFGKHRRRVIDGWFARLARTPIVVNNDAVIAGEFLDLIDLPNFPVASRFTEKHHRPPLTVFFVVDLNVIQFNFRHIILRSALIHSLKKNTLARSPRGFLDEACVAALFDR